MFIQAVLSFSIVSCFCPSVAEAPSPFRRVPVDGVTRQRQGIVHGAGGAPRQAQVLSAGRGMAARPILPALPAGSIAIPAGSMLEVWFMEQGERHFQPGPAPRESMPLGAS